MRFGVLSGAVLRCAALAGGGGRSGGGGADPSVSTHKAKLDVDVKTGKVTMTRLSTGRAVYGGSAVSFTISDLLSNVGEAGERLIGIHAVHRAGDAWGAAPVRLILYGRSNASAAALRQNVRVSAFAGETNGHRTGATFNGPSGIAMGQGQTADALVAADSSGSTIRRIGVDVMVSTLAGLGGSAMSADGTGSPARTNWPRQMASSASDSLFIADPWNNGIRRITPRGRVTTVAGAGGSGETGGSGVSAPSCRRRHCAQRRR